jgi:hypothetical protein
MLIQTQFVYLVFKKNHFTNNVLKRVFCMFYVQDFIYFTTPTIFLWFEANLSLALIKLGSFTLYLSRLFPS